MDIATSDLTPDRVYKLLVNTIIPRPIALVSTMGPDGTLNAAPFSFFNAFSNAPPLLVIGIEGNSRDDVHPFKDTARNIQDRGEFVVNMVSRSIAEKMLVSSLDFDTGVSEFEQAGFTPRASKQIATPGIAEAPASMECRTFNIQYLPYNRIIVTGEILHMHFADGVIDEHMHIDADAMDLVARLHGASWYSTTRDRFELNRVPVDQWLAQKGGDQQ
ncbi:flavin reductase family protein [Novosphingobium terrae]|uniref:flavin reductase family protein n=1 Tax=Novosphingobium terrae TaxID=2726189 RepID=UPI00198216E7|nr:flavin reductase family protein [Novosphingobium terrae]